MAERFDCLGLELLTEEEEVYENFAYGIINKGRIVRGYGNNLYCIHNYGSSEFIVRVELIEDENRWLIQGVDTHTRGPCEWDVRVSMPNVDPKDADVLQKRVMVHHAEKGTGMAIVNLVNADVLPSYMTDDLIHMQIVGLADSIEYYASAEEFEESIPAPEIGFRTMPAEGMIAAIGFMRNRNPDMPDYDTRPEIEDINLVRGVVTELRYGTFEPSDDEEPFTPYIRCFVETQFGTLEIEHTLDQVKEDQRENMKVGATISAGVILSGDVAVDEYEEGIIVDEEHDLSLLRYSMISGPVERFMSRVADDCVYVSDVSGKELTQKEEIEKYIRYVKQSCDHEVYVYKAILDEPYEEMPQEYWIGRKCLAIAYDDPNDFEQVAFIDYDESKMITKITFTSDERIRFRIEEKPIYEKDRRRESYDVPETFFKAMLLRAQHIFGMQCEELEFDDVSSSQKSGDYRRRAERKMESIDDKKHEDSGELMADYRDAFGTLFAESLGMEDSERAYELGSILYNDFARYHDDLDINEDYFKEGMVDALIYTQAIGKQMKKEREESAEFAEE